MSKRTRKGYVTAAQRRRMPHAGPGESYPLSPGTLRAAWDLAGRTKSGDPDSIRRKVLAYARKHGLMGHLPDTAIAWARQHGMVTKADLPVLKASRISALMHMAWNDEAMEGDTGQRRRLVRWAAANNALSALPDEAHGMLHDMAIPHEHSGVKQEVDETGNVVGAGHSHTIKKATDEPVEGYATITKAWQPAESDDTVFEAWLSTEDPDTQKDIVPPEAFKGAMPSYLARKAPLSTNHNMQGFPVGHLQRVALVRNGRIFDQGTHPDDPADFEHFPGTGTGVYVRGVVTDSQARTAVLKGNLGGMSWVGHLREYDLLPNGGRRYGRIEPWLESTLAAYPVNTNATLVAAKAETEGNMDTLEKILLEAADALEDGDQTPVDTVTKAEIQEMLKEFSSQMSTLLDEKVEKALTAQREPGVGRQGPPSEDPRDADPVAYVVAKAARDEDLEQSDKDFIWGVTHKAISQGMTY